MDWVDRPKNCKGLYGILQLLQGSHFDNFPQKTLKLGRVAFHSLTFQFQCLDFQSNRHTKLAPVPSRFSNGLLLPNFLALVYLQQYLSLYSQRLGYLPAKFEKLVSILNLES